MPWTTPRTWTDGETNTAALMNTSVQQSLLYLGYSPSFRVFHNTTQSIAYNTYSRLSFNTIIYDYGNDGTNNRVSSTQMQASRAGVWHLDLTFSTDTNAAAGTVKDTKAYIANPTTGVIYAWGQVIVSSSTSRVHGQAVAEVYLASGTLLVAEAYTLLTGGATVWSCGSPSGEAYSTPCFSGYWVRP